MSTVIYSTDQHGWAELLPDYTPQPKLATSQRAPWVVVGAGVTGLACARRLAELHRDEEIILLDARQVGQGASGRNSGFAVAVTYSKGGFRKEEEENYRRINRINQAGLETLRQQVQDLDIDCQWQEDGFHYLGADQISIRECDLYLQFLNNLEIEHTVLDHDNICDRLGTKLYQKGVHIPHGVLLQPAALVRGLAERLPPNVRLYEQSPVVQIDNGSPLTLKLGNCEIKADNIILATNYEASSLGYLNRYLIGSTLSGSFTRVLTKEELDSLGSLQHWGVLSLHEGGATVRLTPDHRICIRNTAEYHGGALLSEHQLMERQDIHRQGFESRFPQLANVPFEYAWSGVEGISRNFTNFFGRQREHVYFAGGYNGSGVSRGTAFGTALAEYASGETSLLIKDCLASAPGSWIPPRPLLDVGAYFSIRSRFAGVGLDR